MSDFAKNLRYYRKQKRLSQAELAKALNYGDTTISNYESGRNEPSFDDLINLSHKLSVTPNDLIGFSFMDKDISFIFRFNQLETKHKKIILDLIQALIERSRDKISPGEDVRSPVWNFFGETEDFFLTFYAKK